MISMQARNVNDLYYRLMKWLPAKAEMQESRNGKVLSFQEPVFLQIDRPYERVLFSPSRNCNHTFHLIEAIWMLAGRRDVDFVSKFNSNIGSYSDDGEVFNAAYGYRWREHFKYDQINTAIQMLKTNPDDRRVVIGMWDPYSDLGSTSKDIPCNTSIMCRVLDGALHFTITNRSNDLVWGLCGANAVHMSFLQEYMAAAIGVKCGRWYHMSNNLHVYEKHWDLPRQVEATFYAIGNSDYWWNYPGTMPLVAADENPINFMDDCIDFVDGVDRVRTKFFQGVVRPMVGAWAAWKEQRYVDAIRGAMEIKAPDWRSAQVDWYKRALEKKRG